MSHDLQYWGLENLAIFDIINDKLIFDRENACHLTFCAYRVGYY